MALASKMVKWRSVSSSNVEAVGWPTMTAEGTLPVGAYVKFKDGTIYLYTGVSRQRVVAMSRAESVGKYLNSVIKPKFPVCRVA